MFTLLQQDQRQYKFTPSLGKNQASHTRNGHPRQGVKHTEESKEKIKRHRLENPIEISPETRKKLSEANAGERNGFHGKKHTPETRAKMSELAKKRAKRGPESNLYGKTFPAKFITYIHPDGKILKLRSSWEKLVADYLCRLNLEWHYESQAFPVNYEFEGETKSGTYIPDFILSDTEIWEVKGYWRKDAKAKIEAFKRQHPNINVVLLDKNTLRDMGLL